MEARNAPAVMDDTMSFIWCNAPTKAIYFFLSVRQAGWGIHAFLGCKAEQTSLAQRCVPAYQIFDGCTKRTSSIGKLHIQIDTVLIAGVCFVISICAPGNNSFVVHVV